MVAAVGPEIQLIILASIFESDKGTICSASSDAKVSPIGLSAIARLPP
jgi:hypothetical protein